MSEKNLNPERYNNPNLWFDTIPMGKLVFLSIITLGIYEMVWSYHCWKRLKDQTGYVCSPFWRAFFCTISNFWLFDVQNRYFQKFNMESFNVLVFALFYFFIHFFGRSDSILFLFSLLSILPIAYIQSQINKLNLQFNKNTVINGWNLANTLWSIPCAILFLLVMIGLFIQGD